MTRDAPDATGTRRVEVEVRGVVQGVGFRPFVWRLARRHGVGGWVRNRDGVVEILAEGRPEALEAFTAAIAREAPPLARVDSVVTRPAHPAGLTSSPSRRARREGREAGGRWFRRTSPPATPAWPSCSTPATAATGTRSSTAPTAARGSRSSKSLPYDRERTSMRAFPLCPACAREYGDPSDRRFHAEPVACPDCGPRLSLVGADGRVASGRGASADPIRAAARLLREGAIVAVKGLGGFQLACDATNEGVVAELRRRKARPGQAVRGDGGDARRRRGAGSTRRRMRRRRSPAPPRPSCWSATAACWRLPWLPGHRRQGAMLPSTPLHHLLLREAGRPLVMTSGNRSDEPICTGNDEAIETLGAVADAFLLHDRGIVARYDDSVTGVWRGAPVVLRRARGLAPAPLRLAQRVAPTLGVGAELHAAFCLAGGDRAFLGQHVGDLDSEETWTPTVPRSIDTATLFGIEPEVVAHDLHPDFASTRLAESLGLPSVAVQHHHAHVAAVMAEHGLHRSGAGGGLRRVRPGRGRDRLGRGVPGVRARRARPAWDTCARCASRAATPPCGGPLRMALAHAADAGVLESMRSRCCIRGRAEPARSPRASATWCWRRSRAAWPRPSPARRGACSTRWPPSPACAAGRRTTASRPCCSSRPPTRRATGAYPIEVDARRRASGGRHAPVDRRRGVRPPRGGGRRRGVGAVPPGRGRRDRACLPGGAGTTAARTACAWRAACSRTTCCARILWNAWSATISRSSCRGRRLRATEGLSLGQVLVAHGRREAGLAPERR